MEKAAGSLQLLGPSYSLTHHRPPVVPGPRGETAPPPPGWAVTVLPPEKPLGPGYIRRVSRQRSGRPSLGRASRDSQCRSSPLTHMMRKTEARLRPQPKYASTAMPLDPLISPVPVSKGQAPCCPRDLREAAAPWNVKMGRQRQEQDTAAKAPRTEHPPWQELRGQL